MAQEDFDIDSLAAYLHLTPQQVSRLVERGKLPGRKVAGQWRFSPAEIHHWLEDRIGASDEESLIEVEGVLQRGEEQGEAAISLSSLLPLAAISANLPARTRNSVITAMVDLAAQSGLVWDPEKLAEAVRARENLHPTALDSGVALLHPRRPMPNVLAEPLLALGKTSQSIPFGGARGGLTDVFFLIASVDDRGHLRTLARLSRLVSDAVFLATLRGLDTPADMLDCLKDFESRLLK